MRNFPRAFGTLLATLACLAAEPAMAGSAVIRVGASPVISSAGLFIAQEKGYFKDAGLAVEITPFRSSGAAMTALLSKGELDVGGGNLTAGLWAAMAEGVDLRVVADKGHVDSAHDYIALLVATRHLKSGRYKTFKDLKGFRMGLTAGGGVSQEIAAERFLREGGLRLSDVTFVKMAYSEMNLALKSGELDATVQLEPYVTQAALEGFAMNVSGVARVYPGQASAAIFYSPRFAREREDDAVKFLAAYLRGVRDYESARRDPARRAEVARILKASTEFISDEVLGKMIPVGLNPDGRLNVEAVADDVRWYQEHGYLKKAPEKAKLVDHRFVDRALKLIGRAGKPDGN